MYPSGVKPPKYSKRSITNNYSSLSVGHIRRYVDVIDILGSRQGAYHLWVLTERANGHWRARFACHAPPCSVCINRKRMCVPFAFRFGAEQFCMSLKSVSLQWASMLNSSGRSLSSGVGVTVRDSGGCEPLALSTAVLTAFSFFLIVGWLEGVHSECFTVWATPPPASVCRGHFSCVLRYLRELFPKRVTRLWLRLFQDVISPVCFWVRSFPGADWRSQKLHHVSGHSARWKSVCGWLMFPLREYNHCGVTV